MKIFKTGNNTILSVCLFYVILHRSYIPNLDFEDNFLKSLGFEPCAICIQNEALEVDSLD